MIPLSPLVAKVRSAQSPFTAEQQQRFDANFERAVAKYPPERRKAALLPVLHLAQDELGWLPDAAMAYVGLRLEVPPVRVREVVTFYTMYRLRPVGAGRHVRNFSRGVDREELTVADALLRHRRRELSRRVVELELPTPAALARPKKSAPVR